MVMKEWFEQDDFWKDLYPFMFSEERLDAAKDDVEQLLTLSGFKKGKVLDLCCGPGRHTVEIAKRGIDVTAVDRSPFLLGKAKARARKAKVRVEWIKEDMRRFIRPKAFDLVINLFTSFGYFDNKNEDRKVLKNIFKSLKPGGVCVMEMMGKERLAKIFLSTSSESHPDGSLLVQRREIFDGWTRIRNEWILIRKGKAMTFKFHHTVYSGQELKERLLNAGFSKVNLYGDFKASDYDNEANRLVAMAVK
jgi:SAM-dependent methyltransferase